MLRVERIVYMIPRGYVALGASAYSSSVKSVVITGNCAPCDVLGNVAMTCNRSLELLSAWASYRRLSGAVICN